MSGFDRVLMVDWMSGTDTGPKPRKDAIWIGEATSRSEAEPLYQRNRQLAEETLTERIETALDRGERLMIGFDFPFGYPRGFARAVTGSDDPFALWSWIAERLEDSPRANNRFHLAAEINGLFPGGGPFWFNGLRDEVPGLPRKKPAHRPLPERRLAEQVARGAFTCWQMGGAGAVGGQVLTGLPVLHRLRQRFAGQVAVWPFEKLSAPVALVEIWPSLLGDLVKGPAAPDTEKDARQVRLCARAFAALEPDLLSEMLAVEAPEEGWILGLGPLYEAALRAAAVSRRFPPPGPAA